jgi:16S rRNA (cytosine967-C5)-methyltransferase
VVAGDAQRHRLPRLAETARRCDANIALVAADVLASPFEPASFDAVLIDAPCTATGVMARHPDARWRLSERAIVRAAARQSALLAEAAALVRPDGILIYATCSLEPEENTAVVDAFLRARGDFRREPPRDAVDPAVLSAAGDLVLQPQRHGTDGAYAARLRRAA